MVDYYYYCITESCSVHTMKGEVEILLHPFLTAVLYGASRPGIFNPLNAELNSICHLLALLGAHHILHFSRVRVNP
jgi:hypothetical protein